MTTPKTGGKKAFCWAPQFKLSLLDWQDQHSLWNQSVSTYVSRWRKRRGKKHEPLYEVRSILRNQETLDFSHIPAHLAVLGWCFGRHTHVYAIHTNGPHWELTKINSSFSQLTEAEKSWKPQMRALTRWDLTVGWVAEPDAAAEHADFMAGETSPSEWQQELQSGAGGKPCESWWVLSQGLLRRFTSLILIVVYSSMAASRAAGTPPPLAPPSHPPGDHPSSEPSLVPIYPHPWAPTQHSYLLPLSGTRPHPLPLGAGSCPRTPFTTSCDPSPESVSRAFMQKA